MRCLGSARMTRPTLFRARFITFAAIFAAASGCVARPTSILVRVATDLAGTPQTLSVRVQRADGARDSAVGGALDHFVLVRPVVHDREGFADVGSFTVIPPSDRSAEPVDIDVTLSHALTGVTLRRRARVSFVAGQPQQLRLTLRASCASLTAGCTTVAAAECTLSLRCEERGLTCGDDAQCTTTRIVATPLVDAGSDGNAAMCPDPTACVARECQVPVATCVGGRTQCATEPAPAGTACATGACTAAGVCGACGGAGQPCCGADACRAGLVCATGQCGACGGAGQPCCGADACLGGLVCASGQCAPCGERNQRCCAGNCGPGTTCTAGLCR